MPLRIILAAWLIGAGSYAHPQGAADRPAKRPLTLADAIETVKADNEYVDNWTKPENVGVFSPDGSKFAFITQKSDLKRDVVAYSLWVIDTANALTSPRPKQVAKLSSSSNRPAISSLKWLPDNNTLVFLGEQPDETPQVYKAKSSTGHASKLTNQSTPIVSFSIDDAGESLVYLADVPAHPVFSPETLRRGFFVSSDQDWEELYTNKRQFDFEKLKRLYIKRPGIKEAQQVGGDLRIKVASFLQISPNGKYAILRDVNTDPPAIWDDYKVKSEGEVVPLRSACLAGIYIQCEDQYLLVDLENKTVKPLINAPNVFRTDVLGWGLASWSFDNSILLVNALLPLDSVGAEEREARKGTVYTLEITLPDEKIHVIDERDDLLPAFYIDRDETAKRIVTRPLTESLGPPLEFQKVAGKWKISKLEPADANPRTPLKIAIDEGINLPPKLVATDPKTGQKIILLDFNPQISQFSLGKVQIFKWKGKDGEPSGGELYYPTDYVAGKRYPLVIQTHGESRERFWIDGPFPNAAAAQVLANQQFFVLQVGWGDRYDKASFDRVNKIFEGAQEGPFFVAMLESAIDELDHRGLIDRNRVGLEGFSRSVYDGEYLLTHSAYPIKAAVMVDGVDFGYVACVLFMTPVASKACEEKNGGVPWGKSLAEWQKASPPMRLDAIHTPVLLQSIEAPLGEWEIYRGLQWLKKPVDLVNFFPEGDHVLVRPQQKLLSEQSAVDWYCFWLKNEEDPDPAKAKQYARWRQMRDLQDGSGAKASPSALPN